MARPTVKFSKRPSSASTMVSARQAYTTPGGSPMFFIVTSPGSWISPDSMTSTSGRLATSSGGRSSGRATSVMTQPGLTFMMSSTFLPAPEVAVTIMSISATSLSARAARCTLASGVSFRIESFSASSLAVSGDTR